MATTRTRKASPTQTSTAKTAAKKTTRRPAKKATARPVSLTKPTPPLPTRNRPWMTDAQGYATLAARIAGITTQRIQDWHDHRDGTTTRPLNDGSLLHYTLATRTLTWHTNCPMGAIHAYVLDSPSTAAAARVHAARCTTPHADLTRIPALTADELADLGILHTPTWARPLPGEPVTESIPVPLPAPERVLGDQLTHSTGSTADTQPMSVDEIRQHIDTQLAARADSETPKEHPQP